MISFIKNIPRYFSANFINLYSIRDFKFPLGKNHLFMLHHFKHKDYKKYIGFDYLDNLTIGDNQIAGKIF